MLVNAGWDPDLVMGMADIYRKAFYIIHRTRNSQSGETYNFRTQKWELPKRDK